ncbi:hypothetical protein [Streptomyces albus]|uniref:hypothetical protein n=1 Tax=Streptomyces albus TaxID=1888 RepID=UPI0006E1222E|nr:hypothetical protein [Streptomyces albus]
MKSDFPYFSSQDPRGDLLTAPVAERNARRSRGVAGRITWAHSLWIDPELEHLYGGDRHDPAVNRDRAVRLGIRDETRSADRTSAPLVLLASTSQHFLTRVTALVQGDPDDEVFDLIRRTHSGYLCELAIGVIHCGREGHDREPFTARLPVDSASPVTRAAILLESAARELLAQWYDAHCQARGEQSRTTLLAQDRAQSIFASSVRHEFCRRVKEEPGFTDAQRRVARREMEAAAERLPSPERLRAELPGGVQGSVVNELLCYSYPLWDRVRFCLDSPFDGLKSL